MDLYIPDSIRGIIGDRPCEKDTVGLSGATVLLYDDVVFKVDELGADWNRNLTMLQYFKGKFQVPEIIKIVEEGDTGYLLLSRLPGKMPNVSPMLYQPKKLAELLADNLLKLWALSVETCPVSYLLDEKIASCEENVKTGYVPNDSTWPRHYGDKCFADPESLLLWVKENKPKETDLVVTHGDMYMSNFLVSDSGLAMLDFGWSGVADRYQDLALCLRSFRKSLVAVYKESIVNDIMEYFYSLLGIDIDIEKLWYYILLDKLV